jgi:ATP-dependent DNA helicase DinG
VHRFYQGSLKIDAEFAVNVWALATDGSDEADGVSAHDEVDMDAGSRSVYWRWQLLRLQDGKADEDEGFVDDVSSVEEGEICAMTEALTNLRQRIERAGQETSQYAIELRCSAGAARLVSSVGRGVLLAAWQIERDSWRSVTIVPLNRGSSPDS